FRHRTQRAIRSHESAVNHGNPSFAAGFRAAANLPGRPMNELPRPENGNRQRRATLNDVAALAGVSAVTASRALRHPEMVSADLRERVASAVESLAYIPSQLASALASARTGTIGVLIPS